MLRIQVVQVAEHAGRRSADTGIRRYPAVVRAVDLAAEAADVGAHLEIVRVVVAGAGRQRQSVRQQVNIHRPERRLLLIAARDVVEEHVARRADVGVVGRHGKQRWRGGVGIDGRGPDRREVRTAAVVPIRLLVNGVVFPEQPADRTQPPVVRRAEAHLVTLMRGILVIFDVAARRPAVPGRIWRRHNRRLSVYRGLRERIPWIVTLIVACVDAARVIR